MRWKIFASTPSRESAWPAPQRTSPCDRRSPSAKAFRRVSQHSEQTHCSRSQPNHDLFRSALAFQTRRAEHIPNCYRETFLRETRANYPFLEEQRSSRRSLLWSNQYRSRVSLVDGIHAAWSNQSAPTAAKD